MNVKIIIIIIEETKTPFYALSLDLSLYFLFNSFKHFEKETPVRFL